MINDLKLAGRVEWNVGGDVSGTASPSGPDHFQLVGQMQHKLYARRHDHHPLLNTIVVFSTTVPYLSWAHSAAGGFQKAYSMRPKKIFSLQAGMVRRIIARHPSGCIFISGATSAYSGAMVSNHDSPSLTDMTHDFVSNPHARCSPWSW